MRSESASTDGHLSQVMVGAALVLSMGCAVVATWVDAGSPYRAGEVVTALVISVTAVVGAVVALSVPGNRIGWLVLGLATAAGLGEALTEWGVHGELTDPGSVPGAAWLVTTGVLFRTTSAMIGTAAIPAFYPDGRLPGSRWRWLGVLLGVAGALIVASSLLAPVETRLGDHWRGPLAQVTGLPPGISDGLGLLAVGAVVFSAVGALAGLVVRWRRGDLMVRQQLLLFGWAVLVDVLFLAGVAVYVTATSGVPGRWLFAVLGLPVPVAIAMATLNHGLFDLRRAANRAVLWLLVTAATMTLYVVVVVIATLLAPDRSAVWPPAVAAAIAAAALIPLRDRLQRLVARVVYGRW
ncbi:MAG: hypothetical protein ACRDPB_07990, partial [Nocardioidaceae bacterium]